MKTYVMILLTAMTALTANAQTLNVKCTGSDQGSPLAFSGQLNLKNQSLSFVQFQYGKNVKVVQQRTFDVDERCGTPALSLDNTLTFEVTPATEWGEFLLQLPLNVTTAGSVQANMHLCSYDGDWNMNSDASLVCEISELR